MINIQLGNQELPKVSYLKDGKKREFVTDHNTLFHYMKINSYEEVKKMDYKVPVMETPVLPRGTVKYMALPDGTVVLFMEQVAFNWDIQYHNTVYKGVPFPNLLFIFSFVPAGNDTYKISKKKIFAFKDKVLRDTTELYHFPYSHVHLSGDMCYFMDGQINDLAQMSSFIYNWYNASFTDHYYDRNERNGFTIPLRDIFATTGHKRFNMKMLKKCNQTVRSIANTFVTPYFEPEQPTAPVKNK